MREICFFLNWLIMFLVVFSFKNKTQGKEEKKFRFEMLKSE